MLKPLYFIIILIILSLAIGSCNRFPAEAETLAEDINNSAEISSTFSRYGLRIEANPRKFKQKDICFDIKSTSPTGIKYTPGQPSSNEPSFELSSNFNEASATAVKLAFVIALRSMPPAEASALVNTLVNSDIGLSYNYSRTIPSDDLPSIAREKPTELLSQMRRELVEARFAEFNSSIKLDFTKALPASENRESVDEEYSLIRNGDSTSVNASISLSGKLINDYCHYYNVKDLEALGQYLSAHPIAAMEDFGSVVAGRMETAAATRSIKNYYRSINCEGIKIRLYNREYPHIATSFFISLDNI